MPRTFHSFVLLLERPPGVEEEVLHVDPPPSLRVDVALFREVHEVGVVRHGREAENAPVGIAESGESRLSDLPRKPTAAQALLAIASLGGHIKNNGALGWLVLLRGMKTLVAYEAGWAAHERAITSGGRPRRSKRSDQ